MSAWAPSPSFKAYLEQKLGDLPLLLIYAALEWVMIALLFVDGLLAFVSNEFSKIFNLRLPCLLCTRIDHVLVHRDASFYYNDSMCEDHKKGISSLAYCHIHKKLSDIRSMCQGCLLSFATGKDSSHCDKYKSLVGILHSGDVEDNPKSLRKSFKNDNGEVPYFRSYAPRWCLCCGEPLNPKVSRKTYTRNLSMNPPAMSPRLSRLGSKNDIELPHIKCKEVRSSLDVESELLEGGVSKVENHQAMLSPLWINRGVTRPPVMDNDASSLNEEDGDIVSRLKRQLHMDQKQLMAVQKELDEERSAAAVAANNAMAMITRLQAEKAAVQMEALQYQRMMDEQAEYDEEAIKFLRDMVLKREEEIKVLESELEKYREKYGPTEKEGSEICEMDVRDDCRDMKSLSESDSSSSSGSDDHNDATEDPVECAKSPQEESSLDFESERSYLLELLADLEKKMLEAEPEDESTGNEDKAKLTSEVSMIKERLRAVEAESSFLKHVAMTLQKGGEGKQLLAEIAQHLRDLKQTDNLPSDDTDA